MSDFLDVLSGGFFVEKLEMGEDDEAVEDGDGDVVIGSELCNDLVGLVFVVSDDGLADGVIGALWRIGAEDFFCLVELI